jgi:hypothetical protein
MTKDITQLTPQAISVSVPLDAGKFNLGILGHTNMLQYFEGDHPVYGLIELPPGNYSILGLGDKLNIDQIYEVIKGTGLTFNQLMESKGLDIETTLILIKH